MQFPARIAIYYRHEVRARNLHSSKLKLDTPRPLIYLLRTGHGLAPHPQIRRQANGLSPPGGAARICERSQSCTAIQNRCHSTTACHVECPSCSNAGASAAHQTNIHMERQRLRRSSVCIRIERRSEVPPAWTVRADPIAAVQQSQEGGQRACVRRGRFRAASVTADVHANRTTLWWQFAAKHRRLFGLRTGRAKGLETSEIAKQTPPVG